MCAGSPNIGASCDDGDQCSENDMCVEAADFALNVTCRGKFAEGKACDNGEDPCGENPVCAPYEEPGSPNGFCKSTPVVGISCDTHDECQGPGKCVLGSGDVSNFAFCVGEPLVGTSCEMTFSDCTEGGVCVLSDYSDGDGGGYAFCEGIPAPGKSCNDYNDCSVDDVCVMDHSGDFAFCQGEPTTGGPCNDYNDCTAKDVCVMSEFEDYALCHGEPTVGRPCDDYNDYTGDSVCVAYGEDYSYCQGDYR